MKNYKLGGIEFEIKQYRNIEEGKIEKTLNEVNFYIEKNNLLIINGFIFTEYKNNKKLIKFSEENNVNLIYSRDNNYLNFQILLVKKDNNFKIIEENNKKIGTNIFSKNINILYLDNIKFDNISFENQTKKTYDLVFNKSKNLGFENKDFVKAWNFIEDILKKYGKFNEIRDSYFLKEKLSKDYPAGTGIDCLLPGKIEHLSNYLFIKSKTDKIKVETVSNDIQCEAYDYGPKFSRAKIIKSEIDKNNVMFISGTASVNEKGESIFVDNIEKNIKYTFKSVENLLKKGGMDFDNIISSFIYIKHKKFKETFLEIYDKNNFKFPYIYNFCDVCRDDFLFEIECVAVKNI